MKYRGIKPTSSRTVRFRKSKVGGTVANARYGRDPLEDYLTRDRGAFTKVFQKDKPKDKA